jgi:hypothetical protein
MVPTIIGTAFPPLRRLRPELELIDAQQRGRLRPIPRMRQTSLREPALSRLDVDTHMIGDVIQPETRLLNRPPKPLVRHGSYPCPRLSRQQGTFPKRPHWKLHQRPEGICERHLIPPLHRMVAVA